MFIIHMLQYPEFINKQDKSGQTPLYVAVSEGYAVTVSLLVQAGANIQLLTSDKKSCVDAALEKYFETDPVGYNSLSSENTSLSMSSTNQFSMVEVLPSNSDWAKVRCKWYDVVIEHQIL